MTVTAMLHRQRYRVIELDRDIYNDDDDAGEKGGFYWMRERWVLLKRPRCDIDGVGEGK